MAVASNQEIEKIVVLDRDGVINFDSPDYIKTDDEWIPIPGSLEAIARLHKSGYRIVVASNQSGLGRGLFDEYALARIHYKLCHMAEELGGFVDGVFYCPHTPEQSCDCRKPATGLLRQIEQEFGCSLPGCYFIGDSEKDLHAAINHGCLPALVRTGNGSATERKLLLKGEASIPIYDDLAQAIQRLFFPANV